MMKYQSVLHTMEDVEYCEHSFNDARSIEIEHISYASVASSPINTHTHTANQIDKLKTMQNNDDKQ